MSAVSVDLEERFRHALEALDLDADLTPSIGDRWDMTGTIEGLPVVIEVKANPTVGDVLALVDRASDGAHKVLAARHLWSPVRDALRAHGVSYFDGRGHLRLWHRPLFVDSDVPGMNAVSGPSSRWRIDSPSALDVALAVLDGTAATGVRAAAEAVGRAPGTISKQLAALRSAYLVDDDGQPVVPALFEAVVAVWRPARIPLANLPRPGAGSVNARLAIGLDDPDAPGWVLADTRAAAAWGAPIVLAGDAPPDFYVPDAGALARARALLGDADYGRHACTLALAPCPYVCRRRYDRAGVVDEPFFAPSPIVAALDLAIDPARGREILDRWSRNLPPELARVW
ncbi:MAG TPA: hypothetical protein VNA57_11515 [Acidimicrobiales bacterium]|nr:hypothetical protein [Acidimicrobiales bacterium]